MSISLTSGEFFKTGIFNDIKLFCIISDFFCVDQEISLAMYFLSFFTLIIISILKCIFRMVSLSFRIKITKMIFRFSSSNRHSNVVRNFMNLFP